MPIPSDFPGTLPVMTGVPDDGLVSLRLSKDGRPPSFVLSGTASFYRQLPGPVRARMPMVFFGPGGTIGVADPDRHQPLVNFTSEADACGRSLRMLEQAVHAADIGCFNHPRAVLDSTRDAVARKLASIDGLHVPATFRIRLVQPAELAPAVEAAGLGWPVIVRVAGTHAGVTTARIDRPEDVRDVLRQVPWGGRELYVTQFVPYADADGMHRKLRLVVVGRRVFLRHVLVSPGWHVHAKDLVPDFETEEARWMAEFEEVLLPDLQDRLDAVAAAMDLDFFGIDCSLRPDGRLLVFEANATMDVLDNTRPQAAHCVATLARITDALVSLLGHPHQWRHPGGRRA